MKKRVLAALLALTMVLCALPVTAAAQDQPRIYGTVPIYINHPEVDYVARQLLEEIDPQGATHEERILAVYNWIIRNCDREGSFEQTYLDPQAVNQAAYGDFAQATDEAWQRGEVLYRIEIAGSSEMDDYNMGLYDRWDSVVQNAAGMMLYRVGSCLQYSALLTVLLGHLGYDCRLIDGEFINSDGTHVIHKWNMVLLDGQYYWLDVRMDHANFLRTGTLEHQYFLVEDTAKWETKHAWDHSYSDAVMANADKLMETYGLLAGIPGQVEQEFPQMDPWEKCSDWAVPYLEQAARQGLLPELLLRTDMTAPITRGEFAAVAMEYYVALSGVSPTLAKDAVSPFTDVTADQTAILLAYQLGIVNGITETTFGPDSLLKREQAATMLGRVAELVRTGAVADGAALTEGSAELTFADSGKVSPWAANYVRFFVDNGAIGGVGNNTFAPGSNMTREQAMKVAVAALGE